MTGFSAGRLVRVREVLQRAIDTGFVPGAVAVLARRGEVHLEALGHLAFDGPGSSTPMAADTILRLGSSSKPPAAACLMTLIEDCTLRLDDPVDELLPELAGMRVLADPGGPLDDTVPARRPITVRDLLTSTPGTGMLSADVPIAGALGGLAQSSPDEWLRRLGELPLVHQPGKAWMYDTAADVMGVLIARATGLSFGDALRERVCEPLGLTDTGFRVEGEHLGRLATAYAAEDVDGVPVVDDGPYGRFSRPPAFESGGGGLVSTAADGLAFGSAMLAGGGPMLSRAAVSLMTTDQLTPRQKALGGFGPDYLADIGWGLGLSVRTRRTHLGPSVGSYGWHGYWGTVWYNDPAEDLVVFFAVQRAHAGNPALPLWRDLWTAVYQAIV